MSEKVTQLLMKWSDSGDRSVLDELFPIVYNELKRIAIHRLKNENHGHTLQPTELAHEAYLKLVDQKTYGFENRAQFFALAAKMMRSILVDYAISKKAQKRGGDQKKISLERTVIEVPGMNLDILALDLSLNKLAAMDELKSRIVELKFFGGLTTSEIADAVGKSDSTVEREWVFSKAWLHNEMNGGTGR